MRTGKDAQRTLHVARSFLTLAIAAPAVAAAQSQAKDTVRLPEVVVTPTRVATARASVAASVTVLSGTQLRERGITSVVEALRDVAGVAVVQPGSFGALASVFLRGGESDHVSVLVDGVPLNQPGGAINLADLTTDNVDRIEIVRGPVSVLYGSDAVAGVVQIFTRRGRGPLRVAAAVEAGRYETATPGPAPVAGGSGRTAARWEADVAGGRGGGGGAGSGSPAPGRGGWGGGGGWWGGGRRGGKRGCGVRVFGLEGQHRGTVRYGGVRQQLSQYGRERPAPRDAG